MDSLTFEALEAALKSIPKTPWDKYRNRYELKITPRVASTTEGYVIPGYVIIHPVFYEALKRFDWGPFPPNDSELTAILAFLALERTPPPRRLGVLNTDVS
jgi:hypothetical protein